MSAMCMLAKIMKKFEIVISFKLPFAYLIYEFISIELHRIDDLNII